MPSISVVIPTYNEAGNVVELVHRLNAALRDRDAEIVFVDDSSDNTMDVIRSASQMSRLPVTGWHRDARTGGLAGAVTEGIRRSRGDHIVVMDGDLQHPPELVGMLTDTLRAERADMVVASRYCGEGDASGLGSGLRRTVSSGSTLLAQACFPRRVGSVCSDPMTGFFCFSRSAVHVDRLQPRGFKILLEILARHELQVAEVPFVFGERAVGSSKASWRNGVHFLHQLLALRMGRMSRFAAVGVLGTLLNLAVMWFFVHLTPVHYVAAAVIAAEASIAHNFVMQERFVFGDMRRGTWFGRAWKFVAFNNVEALVRIPLLVGLVELVGVRPVIGQALLLGLAFIGRFLFTSRVIYRPHDVQYAAPVAADLFAHERRAA